MFLKSRNIEIDTESCRQLLNAPVVADRCKDAAAEKESLSRLLTKSSDRHRRCRSLRKRETGMETREDFCAVQFYFGCRSGIRVGTTTARQHRLSDKIDRVLTHKFFGLVILVAVLLVVFQTIFSWATLPMDLLDKGFGALGDLVRAELPAGVLTDLLVDGIIAGVGGVMVFLPQILLLFLFISILEDTGYMARAAFLLDKLMSRVGLHGKAFLPLMSSFACAIPGIMATRTIENRRDRFATILIAPLMSCSARLPVYTLMIAAFFAGRTVLGFISLGAVLMLAMYRLEFLRRSSWLLF